MKKILLYSIFICLLVVEVGAQQTVQYRYHLFEDYLLNPAYVGSKDYYPVLVGRDQRFYGLTNSSPETYFFTMHSRVGEGYILAKDGKVNKFFEKFGNMALGLQLFQYNFGPSLETNIGLTYGYHLELNQNYKKKNPRKLTLAFTPRLKRLGFNIDEMHLENDPVDGSTNVGIKDPGIGGVDPLSSWMFSGDVGVLYRTVHGEFGAAALDVFQTKNKIEKQLLYVLDQSYETYDSLYPSKFLVNGKLTFVEMYNAGNIEVNFVPSVAAIYGPKNNSSEFFVDLMLEGVFKEHIAGLRSKTKFIGELGLNIHHTRIYEPSTFIQPYITFDFENITIMYAQTLNMDSDLVGTNGISNGNQISVLFKLSNDRTVRQKRKSIIWHD